MSQENSDIFGGKMEKYMFYFSSLILLLSLAKVTGTFDCSSNKACKCINIDNVHFKADCSRMNLSEVPSFHRNVIDIDLSGNQLLTKITKINELPSQLSRLDISKCNLRYIEVGVFEKLKSLKYLDISRNMALTLNVLPNITNDLMVSDIKTLKFNAIQCSVGAGVTLKYEHLCRLQNTSIQEIEMARNRIDMVEQFTLLSLPSSLRNLWVAYNRLRFGPYFMEFISLESVRFIDLSFMYAMDSPFRYPMIICDDEDKGENTDSTGITNGLSPCPEAKKFGNGHLPDVHIIMHMAPNLETLVVNNCITSLSKPWHSLILKFYSLKRIIFSHSFLEFIRGADYSGKLEEANFSYNFISDIDDLFFATSNLTILDLSYNELGNYFSSKRSLQLRSQAFLRILNLSNNKLSQIQHELLKGLSKLEVLNLSDTQLKEVNFSFDGLINLSTLDLSNNRLRTLSESNMQELDQISEAVPLSINLAGNDILCACETINFLQWMQRKRKHESGITLTNSTNYTCSYADSTQRSLRDLNEIILHLNLKCSSKSIIFIISGFALVAFFIIVISGILYRYRWKLRYIYYMTRRSLRGYFLLKDHDGRQKTCYEFDAFISFAEKDAQFAYKTLKSKIESKYSFAKLCYHYEQFIAGTDVAENIVNAVNCSRKTICVLTDNFLASEWCIYEFKMANLEKIYKRGDQNCLLVLMFGSVNSEHVPVDIMAYLESRSYLEVPQNIDDSDVFWDHIISSIIEDN